jgi:hypothetical protein
VLSKKKPFDCAASSDVIMSDLQTSMGDGILQMTVCLRDGKEAVEQLKAIYPDEAENAELDITADLTAKFNLKVTSR